MSSVSSAEPVVAEQSIGPRIAIARENAKMTQAELARRLGVETASLVAWENDEKQPRANRLVMLGGVLNVSMKWLLEGTEGEFMQRGDDPLPLLSAELERLQAALDQAQLLASTLRSRVDDLQKRRRSD